MYANTFEKTCLFLVHDIFIPEVNRYTICTRYKICHKLNSNKHNDKHMRCYSHQRRRKPLHPD